MRETSDSANLRLPLFNALLRYADDREKRHLEAIAEVLFGDGLPERGCIVPELVQTAEVYWSGSDNACMICAGGSRIYRFEYVAVDVPADQAQTKTRSRGMPRDVLSRRMNRMEELVSRGMKRTPAARSAIHAVPYRDQSEDAAVKSLMREWGRRFGLPK